MGRKKALRWFLYLMGMVLLAAGITLNTKSTLGASPIVSVSYCVSELTGIAIGDTTLVWYVIFVAAEVALHLLQKPSDLRRRLFADVLQIPVSLIFTRFMNLFSTVIPVFETTYAGSFWGGIGGRLLVLAAAIALTGVGAAMSLDMRLVPNPWDGIVQTIADFTGQTVGLTKNLFDLGCVLLTLVLSFLFAGRVVGVGVGTILAVLGVGRVIALFNAKTGSFQTLVSEGTT